MMLTIPLTPQQFASSRAKVEAELHQSLRDDAGTIEHDGVKLSYTYDGKALAVNIVHKPFLVPESTIDSKISTWFSA